MNEPYKGSEANYGTAWRQTSKVTQNITQFKAGAGSGVLLNFEVKQREQVIVKTGISYVSMDGAANNLLKETGNNDFNFDKTVAEGKQIWNHLLSSVEVFGKNKDDKIKLYTNLYRCYTGKCVMNDNEQMGIDTFVSRLQQGFEENRFDLGNQPSLATPFYFVYAGKPFLTQHYSRKIASTLYNTSPYEGWVCLKPMAAALQSHFIPCQPLFLIALLCI